MTKSKARHNETSHSHTHDKKHQHQQHQQQQPLIQMTYRGKPDRRPIKFIFVNTDGNICLAPSLTWICANYRLSKGSISDVHNKKVRSYMGWYSISLDKLDQVVKLLGFDDEEEEWTPKIGKYIANPDESYNFIMKQELF